MLRRHSKGQKESESELRGWGRLVASIVFVDNAEIWTKKESDGLREPGELNSLRSKPPARVPVTCADDMRII